MRYRLHLSATVSIVRTWPISPMLNCADCARRRKKRGKRLNNRLVAEAMQRLWTAIDNRQDELIETVAELVRRPSLLGQEADAQGFVTEHLSGSTMETESWELDDSIKSLPNAGDSGVSFAGRPNVTALRRGSGGGRSIILNGHIDVVSPEPISAWTHDPGPPN